MSWKSIDFASTLVCCFHEVNPDKTIDAWYKILMFAFAGMHFIVYLNEMYRLIPYLVWILDVHAHDASARRTKKYLTHELTEATFEGQVALAGIISFLFEDILGSLLQLYGLLTYDSVVNVVFVACIAIQLLETGSAMNSFREYSSALTEIDKRNEDLEFTKVHGSTESSMD